MGTADGYFLRARRCPAVRPALSMEAAGESGNNVRKRIVGDFSDSTK